MTALLWWAIGGVAAGGLAPLALRELIRRGASAAALLCAWGVLVCLIIAVLALPALTELLHRCWQPVHPADTGPIDAAGSALSAGVLIIAVIRGGWSLVRSRRLRHRLHGKHSEMTWVLTGDRPYRGGVLWLPLSEPFAYSLAGQPPLVVATEGLRRVFDEATVSAVLAHERAHVTRRHHLLVALADTVAAGLGWLPLMRRSPSMVRTLVELDADAHAARAHGHQRLRQALHTLQHVAAPPVALGITSECTRLRLARLAAERSAGAGRLGGAAASCGAALVVGVAALLSLATVIAVASCSAV